MGVTASTCLLYCIARRLYYTGAPFPDKAFHLNLSFHFYSLVGGTSIVAFQLKVFLLTYINIIKYYFRKVKKFFNFVLNNLLNLIAPTIEVLIQPVPASPRGGLFLMPFSL